MPLPSRSLTRAVKLRVAQTLGSPAIRTRGPVRSGLVLAAHRDRVTVSLINVTAPLRAKSLPFTATPSFTEIDVKARMLPWNAVLAPSVAELPTCQ